MKHTYFIICLLILGIGNAQSQLYGTVGLGAMNYSGDLQEKSLTLKECSYNFSLGGSYQFAPHFLANLTLTYGKIGASDSKNGVRYFYRNLSFKSNIFEAAILGEADLFDIRNGANPTFINTEDQAYRFTPYILGGIGFYNFNPYTTDLAGNKVFLQPLGTENQATPYSLWKITLPIGLGIKYAVTDNIIVGAEINFRKAFTDYLDDVSQFNFVDTTVLLASKGQEAASLSYRADEIPNTKYPFYSERGNPKKKDNYYSFAIKVIFRFGEGESLFKYGYGN